MSYQFPRRVLRSKDVLDPIELTQDISPAAERLSGRLNAHNFRDSLASSAMDIDTEAFYSIAHYEHQVRFLWTGAAPDFGYPDAGFASAGSYAVQNNFEWNVIEDSVGAPASVSISTGNSVLWVNAYAQYLWYGFDRTSSWTGWGPRQQHRYDAMTDPANVQFAIRVDGNIVPETITGIDDMTYRPSVPIKPSAQRSSTSILPGPADIRGEQTVALGPPCLPVRIGSFVPVQAGTHTVELVVRRVPVINANHIKSYKSGDKVRIFSRQVSVLDLKSFPVDSVSGAEVSAPGWDEEDPVTHATLYTERVQPIIVGYNNVDQGNLARGALMHYHLPPVLIGSYTKEISYTGELFNSVMPGQTSDTVTLSRYGGAPATGWTEITDGGAGTLNGPLRVLVPTTVPQKILVIANVQVRNIKGGVVGGGVPTTSRAASIAAFALFRIMWQRAGDGATTWYSGVSAGAAPRYVGDAMVNNFVWWPTDLSTDPDPLLCFPSTAYGLEQVEIQVMRVFDFTGGPPAASVTFGLFGGTSCGVAGGTAAGDPVEYEIRYGNITALALRA